MEETGLPLNNHPGDMLAKNRSKEVFTITSTENSETIAVVAYSYATGSSLPPALTKGKKQRSRLWRWYAPWIKTVYVSEIDIHNLSDISRMIKKKKSWGNVGVRQSEHIILIVKPSHKSYYLQSRLIGIQII